MQYLRVFVDLLNYNMMSEKYSNYNVLTCCQTLINDPINNKNVIYRKC